MSIDQGTQTATIAKSDRCWRAEQFCDVDGQERLAFHREITATDTSTNTVVSRDRTSVPTVQRTSQQVANKSYTASGVTVTGLQLMRLIYKMADTERQYDIDNPPQTGGPPGTV